MELYLRGDQIATFTGLTSSGNNNGVQVTLTGVQTLGGPDSWFRVVVRQFNPADPFFTNGQFVDIYAWPEASPPAPPLYSNLNPGHDQFQGRASSGTHNIFTSPAQIVFQTAAITGTTLQYGPGATPPRAERLPFSAFPSQPPVVPCFLAGTRILTERGPCAVERIRPGQRVMTRDNGLQTVLWAGGRTVPGLGHRAPIRLRAGTVGNARDLLVSPQHRILIEGWPAQVTTGEAEVLVAARHLVGLPGVAPAPRPRATYVHLLLPRHEIVLAEGAAAESLWLGGQAVSAFGLSARARLHALFPARERAALQLARPSLRRFEADGLVAVAGGRRLRSG